MDFIMYFLILVAICAIYFIITRVWVGAIDGMFSLLKKAFHSNKSKNDVKWHTLEEIRSKKENLNK